MDHNVPFTCTKHNRSRSRYLPYATILENCMIIVTQTQKQKLLCKEIYTKRYRRFNHIHRHPAHHKVVLFIWYPDIADIYLLLSQIRGSKSQSIDDGWQVELVWSFITLYHPYTARDVSRLLFQYSVEFHGAPHIFEGTSGNFGYYIIHD